MYNKHMIRIPPQYNISLNVKNIKKRILITVNPFSGTKKALKIWNNCIRLLLDSLGDELSYDMAPTHSFSIGSKKVKRKAHIGGYSAPRALLRCPQTSIRF